MTSTQTPGIQEGDGRNLSSRVLDAVARAEGTSPLALAAPLHEAVDPDALEAFFPQGGAEGVVEFDYFGCRVTVRGDDRVEVAAVDGRRRQSARWRGAVEPALRRGVGAVTLWTIRCVDCEERRTARKRDDELRPFREACPNSGATAFENAVERD